LGDTLFYQLFEKLANEAKKKNIKILEHPVLYEAYQNLSGLKGFIATLSSSNIYKEFSFTQWVSKASLKELDLAYINLKKHYYIFEKRIIDTLLMFKA